MHWLRGITVISAFFQRAAVSIKLPALLKRNALLREYHKQIRVLDLLHVSFQYLLDLGRKLLLGRNDVGDWRFEEPTHRLLCHIHLPIDLHSARLPAYGLRNGARNFGLPPV